MKLRRTASLKSQAREVVDVTDGGEPWTDLREAKRTIPKPTAEAAQVEACKGKKTTTKRVPPSVAKRAKRRKKASHPATKKAKKTLILPPSMPTSTPTPRGTVISSRGLGFDLSEFMESFQPGSTTLVSRKKSARETHRVYWKSCRAETHCSHTPNVKGELPPAEVSHRTTNNFPESSKKAKRDYNPRKNTCWSEAAYFGRLGP
ncbi:hypothetical protein PHPALM_28465 [Phytophthora palmivora]|uniref:Uncharacterized protein n=1 Tax=Phytophthora palmivora TaxID=4796 RepID=A0A2P4XA14_9STRA|nr:hypothetical protein PHPALM_28465 [Phytophthora palmivora]